MTNKNHQKGFSLIEVLIGMLILTIGILGMASMQVTAKRLGYDALQRSIAINLAHDIAERMRSNRFAMDSYITTATYPDGLGNAQITKPAKACRPASSGLPPTTACAGNACDAILCTDAQIALNDLYEWEQALEGANEKQDTNSVGGLVNPRGCISNVAGLVTIAIAWDGFQALGNPVTDNPVADQCGIGQDLYGTDEEERQVLFLTTFINTNTK